MKINGKEITLKITPAAIRKTEEMDRDFDILKLIREATNDSKDQVKSEIINTSCKLLKSTAGIK